MTRLRPPRAVTSADDCSTFRSGERSLDDWLNHRAIKNEESGGSRTFVSVDEDTGLIAGYYCLSAGTLVHEESPGRLKRGTPNPIPVILIGRLAVDEPFQGIGLGASLLRHSMAKGLEAAQLIGARAFLVHALSGAAVSFYERFGFVLMPDSERTLYVLMKDAVATVSGQRSA